MGDEPGREKVGVGRQQAGRRTRPIDGLAMTSRTGAKWNGCPGTTQPKVEDQKRPEPMRLSGQAPSCWHLTQGCSPLKLATAVGNRAANQKTENSKFKMETTSKVYAHCQDYVLVALRVILGPVSNSLRHRRSRPDTTWKHPSLRTQIPEKRKLKSTQVTLILMF